MTRRRRRRGSQSRAERRHYTLARHAAKVAAARGLITGRPTHWHEFSEAERRGFLAGIADAFDLLAGDTDA